MAHAVTKSAPMGYLFAAWIALLLVPATAAAFELPKFLTGGLGSPNANRPVGATAYQAQQPYDGFEIPITSRLVFRPALFTTEGGVLGVCILFLLIHYAGKARNRQMAERWAKKAMPLLSNEFASVADDTKGRGLVIWNGGSDALIFASGRRGCQSLSAVFTLKPRHDPLERFTSFVFDVATASLVPSHRDLLTLTFALPTTADNVYGIFALVDKTALQATRSGRFDLSFTKINDGDQAVTSRGIPNRFAILTESSDLTDQYLGEPDARGQAQRQKIGVADALKTSAADLLESLVISDQPAERPTGPVAVQQREPRLVLTLCMPKSDAQCEASLALLHVAVNIVDGLDKGIIKPRTEAMAKFRKTRAEVDKELLEESTKEQREAEREAKEEAKRKAEKEKFDRMTPAEQARRKELEKKRAQKKSAMKMQGRQQ
ncbi:uncharacterized protein PFL1_04094 [Pseudozyma flocculosa PF-1]|uniref:DUF1682-domain-containing protein n=2 Tax=Pseudozyma flocculosa TaxID=84751 RepID=A0A5C3ET18_9BASI|nr:uncharacterized protein PFL1_04094 [Pseudozyma flocculosa PF-1]EPQ28267.1 hypothetical protein PFL1_04094 [Pseudozyma flocculosa PF-1]SPO35408.1 uncharacterized protein PSFLO_00879 [Pseudozyma flocculosa]